MSNLDDYSNVFQSTWVGLRDQRVAYEKRVEALSRYKGSKGYDKDMAEAEKAYNERVSAIQDDARSKFDAILKRMHDKVAAPKMDVPSDEQIRILQVLSMREHLDNSDIQLAAENLRESDTAMATLADIARRSGAIIPTSYKSKEQQRREAFDALREQMAGLVFWDGSDGTTVRREWAVNRNPLAGGDPSKIKPHTFTTAHIADMGGADMQGMTYKKTTYELCRALVGDDVPWDAVSGLS